MENFPWNRFRGARWEATQTMYTHVSKCKNDKRRRKKILNIYPKYNYVIHNFFHFSEWNCMEWNLSVYVCRAVFQ
jgi:hypothetical protein